jgi:hypothetical protein
VSPGDFDGAVDAYRQALGQFVKGDPRAVAALYSQADPITTNQPISTILDP